MRKYQNNIVRVCVQVLFLTVLFWVGCQNYAYAAFVTDCTNPLPGAGGDCGFDKLMGVAKEIVNFAILIAAPISAIAFMYAGILYFTAAGNEGQIKKAHEVFKKVLIGFIIVLVAWTLVSVIVNTLAPRTSLLGLL
ncbi:MAG: Uncharacterized protein Greene07144_1046 [Parcubacteria group bacterium Greene0714_4]|nr:MAG: Uncharacterized protein Greene101415_1198 [Parcubacteria group bacterium Greene1014_15]TSD06971.1 MAG: Uncharacterized protein Greene07144_1046 [Parcubacteria group bacterium Greene0714_4]